MTWGWERTARAQAAWDDALAAAAVPPAPPRRSDAGLDSLEGVEAVLRTADLTPERIWRQRLCRQWDPASFWALQTGSGVNRQRLRLLDESSRSLLLARLRTRLSKLGPEDYRWQGEVICAVATRLGTTSTTRSTCRVAPEMDAQEGC